MADPEAALSHQARDILHAFGQQPGMTLTHWRNLTAAIKSSPLLVDQLNALVATGHLKAIEPMRELRPHASGTYDDRSQVDTVRLPLEMLISRGKGDPFDIREATFVFAHEVEHGLNYKERHDAYANFDRAVLGSLRDYSPRDYTLAVAEFLAERRRDEAEGQIAGWNAVVSALHKERGGDGKVLTLKEIYKSDKERMQDFIDVGRANPVSYSLKPNLTIEPDFTLSDSPANIEAVGKNFVDKPGKEAALGPLGKSDYANYYGAYALGRIAQLEREYNPVEQRDGVPHITLNLSRLSLSARCMEENGVNLGKNQYELLINDSSRQPALVDVIRHTDAAAVAVPEMRQRDTANAATLPSDTRAWHAMEDAPLYAELKRRLPPETSRDRLAQICLATQIGGVRAGQLHDVVVRDDALFVTGKVPFGHARIDLTTPPPPVHESARQWDVHQQQQTQQMTQFHAQQAQINAQQAPMRDGAGLAH